MLKYSDLESDQLRAIGFIESGEDSLICADVGTGKTVIALTAAQNALLEGEVQRWLVLAPLLVATDTWAYESDEWEHLQHLNFIVACGDATQRQFAIDMNCDVTIMNYENLQWLMDQYPRPRKGEPETLPFDGLICDEIDKLKSVSTNRFKAFRHRIKNFRKRVGLTGTLTPNDLLEAWGQTYIIDAGESFGTSYYEWRQKYFYPIDYKQHKWLPLPGTRQHIIETLSPLAYRLKAKGLPEVRFMEPDKLTLPPTIRGHYDELERQFYLEVKDKDGKTREINAANAAVLKGKLQQICAGFSYVDGGKDCVWHSHDRFEWLHKHILLSWAADQQLLIFYHFNEERDEIARRYPDMHFLGGGISNKQKRESIKQWNAGKLPYMALHPASAGHGLNLQKSAAHHIAFLTIPWSGGMVKQVTGRLARRGQTEPVVYVHTALFDDTVDQDVFQSVSGKLDRMESFLDDLGDAGVST